MLAILLTILVNLSSAADYYIKSLKAPLLEGPKNGSKILSQIPRSSKVEGFGSEGLFIKASANGQQGFINKLFLSDKPVESKSSILDQDVDISSKARKRASGFTSAAAARGLKENSDEVFKALGGANVVALKKMESFYIKDTIGIEFLADPKRPVKLKKGKN